MIDASRGGRAASRESPASPTPPAGTSRSYPFEAIEATWRRRWLAADAFRAEPRRDRPKFFIIEYPPYPNNKLHLGHVRSFTIGDACARYRRMRGYNVLYCQGFDAFGLPNDIAAREQGCHPREYTDRCIEAIRTQFDRLGQSYDRRRLVGYHEERYYRWTQWLFLKLLEAGYVYRSRAAVNWCDHCKTTLADDQLEAGRCWRCDTLTERRRMTQWFVRTTAFAESMLEGLERLRGWPEKIRKIQAHWIGRAEGMEMRCPLEGIPGLEVTLFTTAPEAVCGMRFVLLAPDHPLVETFLRCGLLAEEVQRRLQDLKERMQVGRKNIKQGKKGRPPAEGVVLGPRAIHPLTREPMPLVASNAVDADFATGAVGGAGAHNRVDRSVARKLGLPTRRVLTPPGDGPHPEADPYAYDPAWVLIDSGEFDGLTVAEARRRLPEALAGMEIGGPAVHYRLRDWQVSRQRYWGTPIPIVYCRACGTVPVPEESLPVRLPEDVDLSVVGNPLEYHLGFVSAECPRCGRVGERETDTLDAFVSVLWFFYRYAVGDKPAHPFTSSEVNYWMPGDLTVGGCEHGATSYFHDRFLVRALKRMGWVDYDEHATGMLAHEMVVRNGRKMSKSVGNAIAPDDIIDAYGADSLRLSALFMASPQKRLEWSDGAVRGCHGFLAELWELGGELAAPRPGEASAGDAAAPSAADLDGLPRHLREFLFDLHQLTADVTRAYEDSMFNVAAQNLMRLRRRIRQLLEGCGDGPCRSVAREAFGRLVRMLAPMTPHLCEELWAMLGGRGFVMAASWPECDRDLLARRDRTVVIQVDGEHRATVEVPPATDADEIRAQGIRELLAQADDGGPAFDPQGVVDCLYFPKERFDVLNLVTGDSTDGR